MFFLVVSPGFDFLSQYLLPKALAGKRCLFGSSWTLIVNQSINCELLIADKSR